ncbi:NAD(P)H-dependent oxidoreductase [Halomicroarcula sp. F13]|uniref:NAD(P)H-dependent oxidoreductase n=1 Tax=Haloarcula rubra TaxID=2487747 RepID=A0AAW4PV25_9EURY|nr:NAD(P)H-dependent oxidoreductase [Halomicroarcula rubra]MBX0324380.1 NAD(P)H-dependent oxidoreductase [Halomicroarcula rubra]
MDVTEREHVVALCGSQRDGSYTRRALELALDAAERRGATTDLVDVADLNLPVFDPEETDAGDAPTLRKRIQAADCVILGSPMYHGSYASPLKTALDYSGFDEFEGTTVGLLAVSGGGFPTPVLEHLRTVARALDAWVLPHQVAIPNAAESFESGRLTEDGLADRIETLGTELVDYAGVESYPETNPACAIASAD